MRALESAHCAATWALVGLIWTVQLVHYPLFDTIGRETFRAYHKRHTRQITWVVAPLMLTELCTGLAWAADTTRNPWILASLGPLAFIWLSTWRVQIPLHETLSNGFDPEAHRRLVSSNWWRTLAWTLRGVCLLFALGYPHVNETPTPFSGHILPGPSQQDFAFPPPPRLEYASPEPPAPNAPLRTLFPRPQEPCAPAAFILVHESASRGTPV